MKKLRILSILLAMAMLVTVFTGCLNPTSDDPDTTDEPVDPKVTFINTAKADPAKAISDGMALTFSRSKLKPFASDSNTVCYEMKLYDDKGEEITAVIDLDNANETGAITLTSTDTDTVTDTAAIYFKGSEFAFKYAEFEEAFGTDTIGIDTNITVDSFKSSSFYKALPELMGLTQEEFDTEMADIDIDTVITSATTFVTNVKKLLDEVYTIDTPVEDTVTVGGEEIEVLVITSTLKANLVDDLTGELVKLVEDIMTATGDISEDITEEEMNSIVKGMADSMPDLSDQTKYYISVETGAVVKIEGSSKVSFVDEYDETSETTTVYDITFGKDPTKEFLPGFSYKITNDTSDILITGKSEIADGSFVFDGELTATIGEETESGTYVFTLDNAGAFVLTLTDEDGTVSASGTLTAADNKVTLTADLSELYEEDETDVPTHFDITVTFGGTAPTMPEYKSILDMNADELSAIFGNSLVSEDIPDHEFYYNELVSVYGTATLDAALASTEYYESYGAESREELIYWLYIDHVVTTLVGYGESIDELNDYIVELIYEECTPQEIAAIMYIELMEY
ncbi:MAG: hypothetical protein IJ389_02355 [Clostridia bacterium]|nr:hypothetical protein [Clostridia bacterium]